jgi:hypothetical protein
VVEVVEQARVRRGIGGESLKQVIQESVAS